MQQHEQTSALGLVSFSLILNFPLCNLFIRTKRGETDSLRYITSIGILVECQDSEAETPDQ